MYSPTKGNLSDVITLIMKDPPSQRDSDSEKILVETCQN